SVEIGTVGAWFAGNAVGVLVGGPLVLATISLVKEPPPRQRWAPTLLSGGAIGLVFAISTWGSSVSGRNLSYLVIVPLMISAVWLGQRHTAMLVGGLAVVVGVVTSSGAGPFAATASDLDPRVAAQLFMSVVQLTVLTVAVEASRRRDVIAELDAILEATVEGVLVVDDNGIIRRANAGSDSILASPPGGLIGRPLAPLVPVDGSDDTTTLHLTRAQRIDASPFWAEVSRGDIQEISGRRRSAVVIRDVTGRIESEERVKQLQDEFVSNMTHELRTPLTAIIGFSDWLIAEPQSPTLNDDLETIRDSALSMKLLIDDILDFKRVASAVGERGPVDLGVVVERSMELVKTAAIDRSVEITVNLDPCPPIVGDADQLDHVVRNLLSNAIKYSNPGGVVTVDLEPAEGSVALSVVDHGIGIPQADQARLFERFFRARNVGDIHGTGLGLALVQQVVTRHAGTLELTSVVDEGTRVRITLPSNGQDRDGGVRPTREARA
ncbi:MAG TPA: ATP-binding protein, partial [Acidimicrobiia bacterium]|nr:ATP-binding protein [Acidimicrobiia bacterium]